MHGRTLSSKDVELLVLRHEVRGTPQNQPEVSPGLGRPSRARRPDPTPTLRTTRPPPDHPGHGPAVAPPPDHQEVDLPEPRRSPTPRRLRCPDPTARPRDPDLGLPAHPRRTTQARPPRRRIHDPQDPSSGGGYRRHRCGPQKPPGDGSCARRPRPRWPWTSSTSTARSP